MENQRESKSDILTTDVVKSCFAVLQNQKSLLIFPILSGAFVVFASTILYFLATILFETNATNVFSVSAFSNFLSFLSGDYVRYGIPFLVVYIFVTYIIIVYFENAIALSVYKITNGEDPAVRVSLRDSVANIFNIIAWAGISAVMSVIFKVLEKKRKEVEAGIFLSFTEFSWGLLTYFVVPIVAIQKINAVNAIKESGATLKNTWGENIAAQIKLFFFFIPYIFLVIVAFVAAFNVSSVFWSLILLLIGIVGLLCIIIVSSTVHSILRTVLFIYASTGRIAGGFMKESLQGAFNSKNK